MDEVITALMEAVAAGQECAARHNRLAEALQ